MSCFGCSNTVADDPHRKYADPHLKNHGARPKENKLALISTGPKPVDVQPTNQASSSVAKQRVASDLMNQYEPESQSKQDYIALLLSFYQGKEDVLLHQLRSKYGLAVHSTDKKDNQLLGIDDHSGGADADEKERQFQRLRHFYDYYLGGKPENKTDEQLRGIVDRFGDPLTIVTRYPLPNTNASSSFDAENMPQVLIEPSGGYPNMWRLLTEKYGSEPPLPDNLDASCARHTINTNPADIEVNDQRQHSNLSIADAEKFVLANLQPESSIIDCLQNVTFAEGIPVSFRPCVGNNETVALTSVEGIGTSTSLLSGTLAKSDSTSTAGLPLEGTADVTAWSNVLTAAQLNHLKSPKRRRLPNRSVFALTNPKDAALPLTHVPIGMCHGVVEFNEGQRPNNGFLIVPVSERITHRSNTSYACRLTTTL